MNSKLSTMVEAIQSPCAIEAFFARRKDKVQKLIDAAPATIECEKHGTVLSVDHRKSYDRMAVVYQTCPGCAADEHEEKIQDWLRGSGIPSNLLKATLKNWTPSNPQEEANLERVSQFAFEASAGFLILLGDVGTGKTHLAVGVARETEGSVVFKTQSELLRQLRATYDDKQAESPIPKAKRAALFILDEVGISGGGKDELPMINEILSHRYTEKLRTIITSNFGIEKLKASLGERMADRLSECCYAALYFGGASHRRNAKAKYFEEQPTPPRIAPRHGNRGTCL